MANAEKTGFAPMGQTFMLHRVLADDGSVFTECGATHAARLPDSRVHRYDRLIGFRRDDSTERDIANDVQAARLYEEKRKDTKKQKSHAKRVAKQATLERYVLAYKLAYKPEHDYAGYLRGLEAQCARFLADEPQASSHRHPFIHDSGARVRPRALPPVLVRLLSPAHARASGSTR